MRYMLHARGGLLLLALVVLLAVALPVSAVAFDGGNRGPSDTAPQSVDVGTQSSDLETDAVVLRIELLADGSAAWTIEHRTRLDDENTTEAFEALQRDVEANRSAYVDRFEGRMADTVANAREHTGREMGVRNVSVEAEKRHLPREYGVLVYRFEWAGFAVASGGELTAGDALVGFFLDSETSLLVSWPDGYALQSVAPEPSDTGERAASWIGPTNFDADEPRVVVGTDDGGAGGDGRDDRSDAVSTGVVLLGLVVVAVVLGALVASVVWRRRSGAVQRETPGAMADDAGQRDATGERGRDERAERETGDGEATESGATKGPTDPSTELLSNEEQVLRLLNAHDGRIKQQEVVQTLGWTDAKTSQVVGALREEGKLDSFRLGRENVLVLPEEADQFDT